MANNANGNPARIDTFGADVTLSTSEITITSIVMEGASAGDTAVFIDNDSAEMLRLSNSVNAASVVWSPAVPFTFRNGFIFDDSASSLETNDFIFIFKK